MPTSSSGSSHGARLCNGPAQHPEEVRIARIQVTRIQPVDHRGASGRASRPARYATTFGQGIRRPLASITTTSEKSPVWLTGGDPIVKVLDHRVAKTHHGHAFRNDRGQVRCSYSLRHPSSISHAWRFHPASLKYRPARVCLGNISPITVYPAAQLRSRPGVRRAHPLCASHHQAPQTGSAECHRADGDRHRPEQPRKHRRRHGQRAEHDTGPPGGAPVAQPPEPPAAQRQRQAAGRQPRPATPPAISAPRRPTSPGRAPRPPPAGTAPPPAATSPARQPEQRQQPEPVACGSIPHSSMP